jgi:membrane peptidoglycan carboxypeptidase
MQSPDPHREREELDDRQERRLARMLFWIGLGIGVTALGATLAYLAVRMSGAERREDPTTQRIQQLIDEANSLLKALDDQRHSA